MLVSLHQLVSVNTYDDESFVDLLRAIKKILQKNINIVPIVLAGKYLSLLAKHSAEQFKIYAVSCIRVVFERFKDTEPFPVAALRSTIDVLYPITDLEDIRF